MKKLYQLRKADIPKPKNIMNTTKSRTAAPNGAAGAEPAAPNENRYRRTNPEAETKINDWIKTNPRNWEYIQAMPRDRLERTVVLNEVRQLERRQYVDTGVLQNIKNNPELKAAYDVLLKDVPEDKRDEAIVSMEREKWLSKKMQSQLHAQSQTRREGVRV